LCLFLERKALRLEPNHQRTLTIRLDCRTGSPVALLTILGVYEVARNAGLTEEWAKGALVEYWCEN
jgi:hypothetical protein